MSYKKKDIFVFNLIKADTEKIQNWVNACTVSILIKTHIPINAHPPENKNHDHVHYMIIKNY